MAESCKQMLNNFVQSMFDEGILDVYFTELQSLQDETNCSFVVDVIKSFIQDAGRIIEELTKNLNDRVVDFHKMDTYIHQIKGSSSSVGAKLVKIACVEFQQACDANNKEGCIQALNKVNNEFQRVRAKFNTYIQLEETILSYNVQGQ